MNETKSFLPLRSWRSFLPAALLPPLVFLLMGMLGGRESLHFMTGTKPVGIIPGTVGILFVVSYVGMWVVSPILVLAAGFIAVRDWIGRRRTE